MSDGGGGSPRSRAMGRMSSTSSIPEFVEVRGMYYDAMVELCGGELEDSGYRETSNKFWKISEEAGGVGDRNLECEAALIAMEIEINAVRRMHVNVELLDVEKFHAATKEMVRMAYDLEDKISETRAHVVSGDFYSLMIRNDEAAMEHYGMARALAQEKGIVPLELEACRRMRWTMSARGKIDEAVTLSHEVLRLARVYTQTMSEESPTPTSKTSQVASMVREHWYLGGYINQEVYALKEHGCVLRGETKLLARPIIVDTHQGEAAATFEDALVALETHWKDVDMSFETDSDGAAIYLSLLAHLADLYDNHLGPSEDNHSKAVDYRRRYDELSSGTFGSNVECLLCHEPLGGLDVDDARVKLTYAWHACASSHHYHTQCIESSERTRADYCCLACRAARFEVATG